ncbi:ATP-dependent DNA helicase RecG, partial [candidate division KSB1 bacterium]|nr:ATP-dependent DNA helicase RecG [candidate division KSB1 bacterium]
DRIEIISPGKLPNNLTVEKIRHGVSIKRNPTLSSFAFDLLAFRGIGSGILRALKAYPHIEFVNNIDLEQFKVIIKRLPLND